MDVVLAEVWKDDHLCIDGRRLIGALKVDVHNIARRRADRAVQVELSRFGFLGIRGVHRVVRNPVAVGIVVAGALWFLVERTPFGIRLRASVDDAAMAGALGVRTKIVYAVSFALAVGLAALGGVVGAQLLPIEPYYALRYMVTFLVVVSVGGAGSIPGALIACLLLGAVETTGRYLMPEYGEFFFYAAVIAIVCIFPNGLLGRAK